MGINISFSFNIVMNTDLFNFRFYDMHKHNFEVRMTFGRSTLNNMHKHSVYLDDGLVTNT